MIDEALEILEEIEENVNVCCAITMDPEEVDILIYRLKEILEESKKFNAFELSLFSKSKYVLCCSSGTDALLLGLISLGLKPNDGVIVPSFTFASTAEAVCMLGGVPFFSDVNIDTFNICENSILNSITEAKKQGITVKGIISVGLFGQPCDIDNILEIATANKLWVLDDAAQSFGSSYKNKISGNLWK